MVQRNQQVQNFAYKSNKLDLLTKSQTSHLYASQFPSHLQSQSIASAPQEEEQREGNVQDGVSIHQDNGSIPAFCIGRYLGQVFLNHVADLGYLQTTQSATVHISTT